MVEPRALAVNITVTGATTAGDLRVYPYGTPRPNISTINYRAGLARANNAVITLGGEEQFTIWCDQSSGTVHVIVDLQGFFR
jgi:hypothetical protein